MRTIPRRSVLPVLLLGVVFSLPAARLTLHAADTLTEPQRLAALGRVWGLLKYYHPDVASGTIDWDQALVDTIPRVQAARTREDLNHELMVLARNAGMSLPAGAASGAILPSDVFGWLDDDTVFDPAVAAYLKLIVTGNQPAPANRYVKGVQYVDNPDFSGDTAGYDDPAFPDQAHRLLALFRYWNMVQYFCPNRAIMDGDWNAVLPEFVPKFVNAPDALAYHSAAAELTARINDTHASILGSGVLWQQRWGRYRVPFMTRLVEGQTVISQIFPQLLSPATDVRVGDVVSSIDGVSMDAVRDGYKKYISASNPDSLERDVDALLAYSLTSTERQFTVTHADGLTAAARVTPVYSTDWSIAYSAALDPTSYRVLPDNIGYIGMGVLQVADVPAAMQALKNTRAIIIDLRRYPNGTMWSMMAYLEPTARAMATFAAPDYAHPGSIQWTDTIVLGPSTPNPDYYKGRLVVLVNEYTQSQAEYSAMGFRSAPATTVIGSRTAGADGNVSLIELPGGISTYFSGITPFYPDGRPTQRVGIVPDVEVRPTIAGIRQGRDELMEAALAFINGQPTTGGHRETPSSRLNDPRGSAARLRDKR